MAVKDVFKVYLYPDPLSGSGISPYPFEEGEDITSGIVNVDIIQGTDTYEGPQEQIDTGQFTIVTRNPDMDPKINNNLKYNSRIQFLDERSGEFFRGYVTDIEVQYQRNDDPIITITGTDIFGAMQRVVIDQDTHDAIMALSTGPTWNGITFTEFIDYMYDFTSKYLDVGEDYIGPPGYPTPKGFWFESTQSFGDLSLENLAYSPAKYIPQVGETYLDVINKYAQTNLISLSAKSTFGDPMSYNYINVSNFPKYDPNYWTPQSDPYLLYQDYDFSSDPEEGKPYETILIDNGYNRVINQVEISNEYRFVDAGELKSQSENFTRISEDSIEDYAISTASISTIYPLNGTLPNEDWASNYSQNIFQITQFPGQEIQQITFDNARYEDVQNDSTYSDYALNQIIRIKHKINNDETIDKIYNIAGITHSIAPDKWEMGFTLKPSKEEVVFQSQGSLPTLNLNSLEGDSNFNFTATIENIDPALINEVVWVLSATDANEITEIWPYAISGNMFKNGLPRTGLTQTWNFDDDGILAPYSFDPDSTFTEPTDNRYGGYGTGYWDVYAFILLSNGFTVVLQQELTVGTPEVQADFGWTQNLTNNFGQVSFVDTSVNHEVGEPDSYLWTFGDGTTSSLRNPVKVYDPAPGQTTYSVSLKVFAYGSEGEKVYNTHTETITLVQPVMVPNYSYTILNSTVTFTNTSTNVGFEEPDAYLWDFGDGTTSTIKNPTKTYAGNEGETKTFNVTLTTRNIWEQTASVTKTISFTLIFSVGNYPVNSIRFRHPTNSFSVSNSPLTPYMMSAKALTSETQSNLLYLRPMTLTTSGPLEWRNASGTLGYDNLNLTRDPSITPPASYGMSARKTAAGNYSFNFQGTLASPAYNLKDFSLTVRDTELQYSNYVGPNGPYLTIFVDIMTNLGWTEVGFFALGRGPMGQYPIGSPLVITEAVKKFTPTRVLPVNTLAFNYTITNNNFTVNFTTSLPGPWLWNFGDGTTSTLQNPTKTYSTRGTYFVNLNGVTEPVKIIPFSGYPFRYIRIKQKLHDGTHAFDTPFIANFKLQSNAGAYETAILYTDAQEVRSRRTSSTDTSWMLGYDGSAGFDPLGTLNFVGPRLNYGNNPPPPIGGGGGPAVNGLRVRTNNANNTSEWDVVIDYSEPGGIGTRIHDITMDLAIPTVSGYAPTVAEGISYEIFTTPYTGTFSSSSNPDLIYPGQSWTKIGEINPTGMSPTILKTYSMTPV